MVPRVKHVHRVIPLYAGQQMLSSNRARAVERCLVYTHEEPRYGSKRGS